MLTDQTGGLSGYEPGQYMLAVLMNSAGQWIWAGNLSSTGCTTSVDHPNGTYTAWITSSLHRPASDVVST